MTWKQVSEIFGFLKAAAKYLDEMAERGDYQAVTLHNRVVSILEEHDEEID
jgi:hypothetical protein